MASPTNFKVEVPVVDATVVLAKVKLPPPFTVTLSDPRKFINGVPAAAAPLTVQDPPSGAIVKDVQVPATNVAPVAGSEVLPVIVTVMFAPT